ncbi:GNAT family N-acetyltransferase [Paenibacillus odorifer]|uniref:GNAT family N-acetyltransferase n=1 Tax=Paenibacillus odorifer TaxID=189426 RepID=UPI002DBC7CF5|nr:GNAT family N-acetyltransferase [Paenibacillus odorifer]MEC0133670.1 GNAT family N-acetyltransferase [Paenibacillus odorifer]MEC0220532.1 GNAT family N-acetyltransferase [Paenibacillus odorifer]
MSEAVNEKANSSDLFTIDCKDIFLREYSVEDLEEFHALTLQPEIIEFLPDWNVPKEQRLDWLINYEIKENQQFLQVISAGGDIGELRLRLGIILKVSGEFIGWCCTGIKEELPVPNREIMYAISKDHRGKGYTTQAAKGLIKYLFDNSSTDALNAIALKHNIPSNRVIQKCGFELLDEITIEHEDYNYYRLFSQQQWDEQV